ncbi:RNI-like protein [Clavulina sp. PMI_390]|nr:RNI-like protein [Clavulina sp. PMI_390]
MKDFFNEVLPIELRLEVFAWLVKLFVDELEGWKNAGKDEEGQGQNGYGWSWSAERAGKMRWVGWEAGVRELVKISQVCKAWQALVFDGQLWATLGGTPALPPSLLSRISASAGPFVHSLQLSGYSSLTPDELLAITANISTSGPDHAPSIIPVQHSSMHGLEHWSTNITSLNLSGCLALTTRSLHKVLGSCPLLENLCLRGLGAVTNTTCILIGDAHPGLVSLDLSRCLNMDAFGVTFVCEAVERRRTSAPLKELRLSGLKRASEWTLSTIARTFPLLEVLDLSYVSSLSDVAIARFVDANTDLDPDSIPAFVELTARQVGLDPMDRALYRRRVTRLRHLSLSHCPSLTSTACSSLAHALPRLEILELGGIGAGLEDDGLVRLLKTTKMLRKLDLEDASRIGDAVLEALTPPAPAPAPTTTPIIPPIGLRLEHLIISYAALISPEAITTLVQRCEKLCVLEADNTRINDVAVRAFPPSQSSNTEPEPHLVVIDCASVGRVLIDDLASRSLTRPRAGFRHWDARNFGYADGRDGDAIPNAAFGPGMEECDESRVVLKSFRGWQTVDRWMIERAKRVKAKEALAAAAAANAASANGGGKDGREGSKKWFGRRDGTRSRSRSGAATPGSPFGEGEDDDRGCTIM